jgi:hypothetical protein
MYAAFRDNNESLPGDEEILKKPSIKIYLYPLPCDQQSLPKLTNCQLIVQKNMTIDALKKYLLKKIDIITNIDDIVIYFKNQFMKNEFSFRDIDKIYHFPDDKIVLYYSSNKIN